MERHRGAEHTCCERTLAPHRKERRLGGRKTGTDKLTMLAAAAWLPAAHGAVARPALRLGGEWAGWRCGFDPFSGAMRSEFQAVTTERWESKALQRRSVQLMPGEDGGVRCTSPSDTDWSTLPVAVSGSTSLMPGARSGLFGAVQVDMLNANAWALDEAVSENSWRCESIFDGLGGERPRVTPGASAAEYPQQRTRVMCSFDPSSGQIAAVAPVLIWQERCWSVRPSEELQVLEGHSGRSGTTLDAAWVDSVVGLACFGAQKRIPYASAMFSRSHLSLPGGVELRGRPGLLEICVTAAPGQSDECKTVLRRSYLGGSCYTTVETICDTQPVVDPSIAEPAYLDELDDGNRDVGVMDV